MSTSQGTIVRTLQTSEISVGIICPLPIEVAAMRQMLDERYSTRQFPRDSNLYHLGRIGKHNIVIAGLPEGLTGLAPATTVAERLCISFRAIKALLLVGIGGGVPTIKNDMRLGDVVVSRPDGRYGGVVQYDFGKSLSANRFEFTGALNSPPRELLATLAVLKSNHLLESDQKPSYLTYLEASQSNPNLRYPGAEHDILFDAAYNHTGDSNCARCDKAMALQREQRKTQGTAIHYGTIASANQLMRDSEKRDIYNKGYDGRILCFEMEAAGLMNSTPCLVIRGISDYADSHKREDHAWHGYAAAAAAAFAKEFINNIPSSELNSMLTVAEALASKDRQREIVNWLTPLNFLAQHNDIRSERQQDTGCWFLEDKRFQSWVSGDYPVLFCPGIPGAGKTMIVSTVVDYLKDRFGDEDIGIAFVYYIHGHRYEQKPLDIYASILKQLVQATVTLPDAVIKLYDLHFSLGTRPTIDEIFEMLNSKTLNHSRIFLVVDGLDECFESGMDHENRAMIAKLLQLATDGRFSLMATSRPIPLITEVFINDPKIEIRANNSDLELFLQEYMQRLHDCVRKAPILQSMIKSEIIKVVDGMFILARLHVESLRDKTTPRKIKDALKELPRGTEALHEAYSGAMERIKNQSAGFRLLAERALTWVTYAQRVLTSSELLNALAVIPGENFLDKDNFEDIRWLLSTCAGLVILDLESDRIRIVHYTAEEYLRNVRTNIFPDGQKDISMTCLTYLSFQVLGEGECHGDSKLENRLTSYPFLSYSAVYWNDHVRETSDKQIIEMSAGILQDEPRALSIIQIKYSSLFRNSGHSSKFPKGLNPLHNAASLGLFQVSKILIARGVDINGLDEEIRTPLLWAVDGGYEELVKLFLENGANPQDEDRRGGRAIHYAARRGFLSLVKSFSSSRDDINRSDKQKQTPLHYAILNRQSNVTEFLLSSGADANAVNRKRRSALHMAIQARDVDLIRSLLSLKAQPETSDNEGDTPLHEAAKLGLHAAVILLLNSGAEINAKNKKKRTPLHMAAMSGYETVVKVLIEKGAILTDIDVNLRTALDWAIENEHLGSVRNLWESVEGPSNVDSEPQKYLLRAAQKGDDAMIGYWLEQGAAINGVDSVDNRTALHYAAMRGRTSIIPTLLRHGSDMNSRDRNGSTPLFMAAYWWKRETAAYLLTAPHNDLTLTNYLGRSLLHLVVERGWLDITLKILDLGGKPNARDCQNRTPLHMAVIGNNLKLVEVLIQKGSSNTVQDLDGWAPSDWACWLGFKTLYVPLKFDFDEEKRNRLIIQRIEINLVKVTNEVLDSDCLLNLARCALFLDARDLAIKIFTDHGTQNPAWICDICLKSRKYPIARSFCAICYDADVCDICFRQKSTGFCHAPSDFLRIEFLDANYKVDRKGWIDELRKVARDRQSS